MRTIKKLVTALKDKKIPTYLVKVQDCKLPQNKVLAQALGINTTDRLQQIHPSFNAKDIKNEEYTATLQNLVIFFGLKYYFSDRYNDEEILDFAFRKPEVEEEYPSLLEHYHRLRGKMTFDLSDENINNAVNLTYTANAFNFSVENMKKEERDFSKYEFSNKVCNNYVLENIREMVLRIFDLIESQELHLFAEKIGKGVVEEVDFERIYMILGTASVGIDTMDSTRLAQSNPPMMMILGYLMGLKSSFSAEFQKLTEIACYNPREEKYLTMSIAAIPEDILQSARDALDSNYEKREVEVLDPALAALSETVPKTVFSLMYSKIPVADMPFMPDNLENDAVLRVPHKMINPALLSLLSENVQLSKDLWTDEDQFKERFMNTLQGMVCYLGNNLLLESTATPVEQADTAFSYAKEAAEKLGKEDVYVAIRNNLSFDLSFETLTAAYQLSALSAHLFISDRQRMKKVDSILEVYDHPVALSEITANQLRVMILRLLDSDSLSNLRVLNDRSIEAVSPSIQLDHAEMMTDTTLFGINFFVTDAKNRRTAHSILYIKYLLGLRSENAHLYKNLKYLGILNPRRSVDQSTGGVFLMEISVFTDDYRKQVEKLLGLES